MISFIKTYWFYVVNVKCAFNYIRKNIFKKTKEPGASCVICSSFMIRSVYLSLVCLVGGVLTLFRLGVLFT